MVNVRASLKFILTLVVCCTAMLAEVVEAQRCPSSALGRPKGNTLYIIFPDVQYPNFPSYNQAGVNSVPANAFDLTQLNTNIPSLTKAQLTQRIFEKVTDSFCEFNVEVIQGTAPPTLPVDPNARWQILAVSSDSSGVFGTAQANDLGDQTGQDYSRVWAGSFNALAGAAPWNALAGSNSTLERWATGIARTVAHEAGHNYGLIHGDENPRGGSAEDAASNHVMWSLSVAADGETQVGIEPHFSDTEYEILGHNIGLNIKTVHNWDFVNPNNISARSLQITVLSQANTLSIDWFYTGSLSPWAGPPTVVNTGSTQNFQGNTYNVYRLEFTNPTPWTCSAPPCADGVVPPDRTVKFHIGASFAEPEAVIVYETKLFAHSNVTNELPLSPRIIGYDAGSFNPTSGRYFLNFFNPNSDRGPLELRNLRIQHFPRLVDINTMIEGSRPRSLDGQLVYDVRRKIRDEYRQLPPIGTFPSMKVADQSRVLLAHLTDKRNVDITYEGEDCNQDRVLYPDHKNRRLEYCPVSCSKGTALSLFPSTIMYVTATVVDPNAKYWDADANAFVEGPLETKVFYQFTGIVPDQNKNGVDDLLDIRSGTSKDDNGNGVPDEVEEPVKFEYAAELVCGLQKDSEDMGLARGMYATGIHVLNPNNAPVEISKKLALTFPPAEPMPGQVHPFGTDALLPKEAIEISCMDIREKLYPNGFPTSYVRGMVTIQSTESVVVSAMYTVSKPRWFIFPSQVKSIDVEYIQERRLE